MKIHHFLGMAIAVLCFVSCAQNPPVEKMSDLSETETTSTFSITIDQTTGGTVSVTPDKAAYTNGEIVKVIATADREYRFGGWTASGGGNNASFDLTVSDNTSVSASFIKRKWTFVLYMAADNDLENAAIQDLNEMEAASMNDAPLDVVALIDRGPGYDSTNGDWLDTRLYRLANDPDGLNTVLVSERIDCQKLGISSIESSELNMADPNVLGFLMSSVKELYPAENYALIVWGHGTGWRGIDANVSSLSQQMKAIAIDDTSADFMMLSELSQAISDKGFSVIGFDTCFGALLEIAYELRSPTAQWLIGSEGATPSTGWDYTNFFERFSQSDFTITAFGEAAIGQFRNQYAGTPKTSLSVIDLSKVDKLKDDFEIFTRSVADLITSNTVCTVVRNCMLNECDLYNANVFPCDTYIDVFSMQKKLTEKRTEITMNITNQNTILASSTALVSSISDAIPLCWAQDGSEEKRISVNLIPFIASGIPKSTHDTGYIRGSGASGQSEFVRVSTGWVPNAINAGSLLDKIFYTIY